MPDTINTGVQSGTGFQPLSGAIQLVYSKEIRFEALPILKFEQFATVKTELTATPGKTIQFLVYSNLNAGGTLVEGVHMEAEAMTHSTHDITIFEQGNAMKFSEYLLQTSFDDVMASATKLLGRDMAITADTQLRDSLIDNAVNVTYPTGATSYATTTSAMPFNTVMVKDSVETLATNNAPKVNGEFYVNFIHPHQARKIRDDSNWINASHYGAPRQVFNGEIGRYEDVIFVETTIMPNGAAASSDPGYKAALDGTGDSGINLYESVLFGEQSFGMAVGLPVELRDNGVTDFGREHGLAWYALWGTDAIDTNYFAKQVSA